MNIKSEHETIMELFNLPEFIGNHHDTFHFIGHPDLNWTLEEKKKAINLCIKSAQDHADLCMNALRILSREHEGCEEISSNKVQFGQHSSLGVFLVCRKLCWIFRRQYIVARGDQAISKLIVSIRIMPHLV